MVGSRDGSPDTEDPNNKSIIEGKGGSSRAEECHAHRASKSLVVRMCVGGRGAIVRRNRKKGSCCPNALGDEDLSVIDRREGEGQEGREGHSVHDKERGHKMDGK